MRHLICLFGEKGSWGAEGAQTMSSVQSMVFSRSSNSFSSKCDNMKKQLHFSINKSNSQGAMLLKTKSFMQPAECPIRGKNVIFRRKHPIPSQ